ncbi:MAG: thioredoxin family protein [Thermodesulfobacteriota bacterium]|nr:thioredoxin family protein [Thermodesulfobacteriota bacterium]
MASIMDEWTTSAQKRFEHILTNEAAAVVHFKIPWFALCRIQETIVADLKRAYQGRVSFFEMNMEEYGETAKELEIQRVPTLIIFSDGEEIQRFVGLQSADVLEKAIESALKK